jgi:hypothetical protein
MTETAPIGLRPRNIGARIKRVEDRRLLTGQGMFTDDRAVAGALHVAFQRSVHAHAVISGIDVGSAAEMPGVVGIYTADDLEGLVKPVRATSRMRDYHATPMYPLARGKVRYAREPPGLSVFGGQACQTQLTVRPPSTTSSVAVMYLSSSGAVCPSGARRPAPIRVDMADPQLILI